MEHFNIGDKVIVVKNTERIPEEARLGEHGKIVGFKSNDCIVEFDGKLLGYTYCKPCYIALGTPYGTSISKGHQCRECGRIIYGRYNYCPDCARKKGFLKEDY